MVPSLRQQSATRELGCADSLVAKDTLCSAEVVVHTFIGPGVPQARFMRGSPVGTQWSDANPRDPSTTLVLWESRGLPPQPSYELWPGKVPRVGPTSFVTNARIVGELDTYFGTDQLFLTERRSESIRERAARKSEMVRPCSGRFEIELNREFSRWCTWTDLV